MLGRKSAMAAAKRMNRCMKRLLLMDSVRKESATKDTIARERIPGNPAYIRMLWTDRRFIQKSIAERKRRIPNRTA
jgi:hypothetical protein